MSHYFLLTIDVEDWFQVENFKQYIPFSSWESYKLRVEKNTHRLLDLLDSVSFQPSAVGSQPSDNLNQTESHSSQFNIDNGQQSTDQRQKKTSYQPAAKSYELGCQGNPKATFFVLGWLAERLPNLVREIHSRGHEVASHGYYHNLCNKQSNEDLKTDLCDSKTLLEDIIGNQVYGYRAPSFAINNDILKIIEECGYLYDSSYNSFAMHGRYGQISVSQNGQKGIAIQISKTFTPLNGFSQYLTGAEPRTQNPEPRTFYELPISNLHFRTPFSYMLSAISSEQNRGGFVLPWGGGGYFRLIPFPIFRLGVQSILKKENAYLFYFHPWEIDPDQPRVYEASRSYKFRHYVNLRKSHSKLLKLIENFVHCNFITCRQYLDKV